jgi:hypothetical protein
MESIISVLHLFACFFSRAPTDFPYACCPPDCRFLRAETVSPCFRALDAQVRRKLPQEIIDCLSLKVRTEEGKQMTTEKWLLIRPERSSEL